MLSTSSLAHIIPTLFSDGLGTSQAVSLAPREKSQSSQGPGPKPTPLTSVSLLLVSQSHFHWLHSLGPMTPRPPLPLSSPWWCLPALAGLTPSMPGPLGRLTRPPVAFRSPVSSQAGTAHAPSLPLLHTPAREPPKNGAQWLSAGGLPTAPGAPTPATSKEGLAQGVTSTALPPHLLLLPSPPPLHLPWGRRAKRKGEDIEISELARDPRTEVRTWKDRERTPRDPIPPCQRQRLAWARNISLSLFPTATCCAWL